MTIRRLFPRGIGARVLDTRASAERRAPTGVFGGRPGSALAIVVTQPPLPDSIPKATLAARQVTKRRPGQRFRHSRGAGPETLLFAQEPHRDWNVNAAGGERAADPGAPRLQISGCLDRVALARIGVEAQLRHTVL